ENQYRLIRRLWQQNWQRIAEVSPLGRRALRAAFNVTLNYHRRATVTALRYLGGIRHWRHEHTDPDAKPPVDPVRAELMRRALQMVVAYCLSADAYPFPREVLRELAPNRMGDWGTSRTATIHFPTAAEIASERGMVLSYLHYGDMLNRMNEIAL